MVVIGAGIGGLTAAIALRRAGLDVVVLERAPKLREVGAGITLWSNAMLVLRAIGAEEAVASRGTELEHGELRSLDGRLLARTPLLRVSRRLGAPCIALRRADLIDALHGRLAAGVVRTQSEVTGVHADAGRVRADLADGTSVEGSVLVGADGIGSRVRAHLHGDGPPRYSGYTCWRAIVDGFGATGPVTPGRAFESWGPGRRFGALCVPGGRVYWFATQNAPAGGADHDARAHLLDAFRGAHAPIEDLVRATPETSILRNDIFDRDPFPRARDVGAGRITLLGDAAHASTPNLGQGACMAIEDALVLARRLAGTADVPAALRAYERDRRARTRLVTLRSRQLGRVGQIENALACRARNVVMRALPEAWTRRAYETIAMNGPG